MTRGGGSSPPRAERIAHAHRLHRQGRYSAALTELDAAGHDADGGWPEPLLRAVLLARLGRVDEAIPVQREAIARSGHPRAWLGLANMLRFAGDIPGAAEAARAAIRLAPAMGEAWWTLANIKTIPLTSADRIAMHAALEKPAASEFDRACVHFALASAFQQSGDTDEAWAHLATANALRAREGGYRPEALTALVDATIAILTPEFLAARAGWGEPTEAPIFIVGMPRAGSTLLEQMLAAGGTVEPLGELPTMVLLAASLGRHDRLIDVSYLQQLASLPADAIAALGQRYLAGAAQYRRTTLACFSDKMPNNWLVCALIAAALPRAHIIDVRRHPLDCGLSNFRENFTRGQAYSYDLAHIGHYYANYARLMDHTASVMRDTVHRVIYERLIENPEHELRSLCDRLGLAYSPAMLHPERNVGAVRTASAAQVREPLNRRGTGAWRRYADRLGPCIDALGPTLENWDR